MNASWLSGAADDLGMVCDPRVVRQPPMHLTAGWAPQGNAVGGRVSKATISVVRPVGIARPVCGHRIRISLTADSRLSKENALRLSSIHHSLGHGYDP